MFRLITKLLLSLIADHALAPFSATRRLAVSFHILVVKIKMDWDHEMEEGPGESIAHLVQVPSAVNDCGEPSEDRGSQCSSLVKTKVYIRGLDVLTTEELKSYLLEHSTPPNRIEWIDDTSANLVFESESIAYDAFSSLSTIPITNCTFLSSTECIPVKPYSSRPEVQLQARFSVLADKKQAGASSRSRFYLLHPEYDPEERRRRKENVQRSRYRDRDPTDNKSHHSEKTRRSKRLRSQDHIAYAGSFDDDEGTGKGPRPRQHQDDHDKHGQSFSINGFGIPREVRHPPRGGNLAKELFPGRRRNSQLRSRSASPLDAETRVQSTDERRLMNTTSRVEPDLGRSIELFPSKMLASDQKGAQLDQLENLTRASSVEDEETSARLLHIRGVASQNAPSVGFAIKGASTAKVRELFPNKFGDRPGDDTFSDKPEGKVKPRRRAEDLFH